MIDMLSKDFKLFANKKLLNIKAFLAISDYKNNKFS